MAQGAARGELKRRSLRHWEKVLLQMAKASMECSGWGEEEEM